MTAFNGASRDPDQVMAGIDRWAQGFADKAQRYQAAQARTEQLRLTASSANGVVRVTVGADGNVTQLQLDAKTRTMPPEELAAQILDTMRRAQSGIADRVSEVMTESLGDEDQQTRAELLDTLRTRFPELEDEEEEVVDPDADFGLDPNEAAPPTPPPPAPPQRPVPPVPPTRPQGGPRRADDDDEDNSPW